MSGSQVIIAELANMNTGSESNRPLYVPGGEHYVSATILFD